MKFKTVDQALRFAFEVIDSDIVKVAKLEMDEVHSTASSGLSPQERHGEAALILGAASRLLPSDCQLYVLSRYSHDHCGQQNAIRSLVAGFIVPALAIKNTNMAVELSSRYFIHERSGSRRVRRGVTSSASVAASHGVHKTTTQYWEDKIAGHISAIAARSDTILWEYLTEKGQIDA